MNHEEVAITLNLCKHMLRTSALLFEREPACVKRQQAFAELVHDVSNKLGVVSQQLTKELTTS